ncbi:MAG TPA: hypothetical protein VGF13_09330 [Verrucomicrobiae bacterium]
MKTISILLLTMFAALADGPIGPVIKSPGPVEYYGKIVQFDATTRVLQVAELSRARVRLSGIGPKAGFRVPAVVTITVPTEDALMRKGIRAETPADLKPGAIVLVTHLGAERLATKIVVESLPK